MLRCIQDGLELKFHCFHIRPLWGRLKMRTGISERRIKLRTALTSRTDEATAAPEPALIRASSRFQPSQTIFPSEIDQHILSSVLEGSKLPATFSCLQLVSRSTWLLAEDWLNTECANQLLSRSAASQSSNSSSKAKEVLESLLELFFSSDPIGRYMARARTRKARKSMNNFSWPHVSSLDLKLTGEQTRVDKERVSLGSARGANFSDISLAEITERGILKTLHGKPLSLSLATPGFDHTNLAALFNQSEGSPIELDLTIEEYVASEDDSAEAMANLLGPLRKAIGSSWKSGTMRIWCPGIDSHALLQCIEPKDWRLEFRDDVLLARHKSQDKAIQLFSDSVTHHESQALDVLESCSGFVDHNLLIRPGGELIVRDLSDVNWVKLLGQVETHIKPRLSLVDLGSATQASGKLTAKGTKVIRRLPRHTSSLKLTGFSFNLVDVSRLLTSIRKHPLEKLALIDCELEQIDATVLRLTLTKKPLSVQCLELGLNRASGEWLMDALPALAKDPCLKDLSIQADGDIHALGLHAVVAEALDSAGSGTLFLHWRCASKEVIVDIPRACGKDSDKRKQTLAKVQDILKRPSLQ